MHAAVPGKCKQTKLQLLSGRSAGMGHPADNVDIIVYFYRIYDGRLPRAGGTFRAIWNTNPLHPSPGGLKRDAIAS